MKCLCQGRRRGSAPGAALERLLRRGSAGTIRHDNEADADEDTEDESRPNTIHACERDAADEELRQRVQAMTQGRRASADGELGIPKRYCNLLAYEFIILCILCLF